MNISIFHVSNNTNATLIVCNGITYEVIQTVQVKVYDGNAPQVGSGGQALHFTYNLEFESQIETILSGSARVSSDAAVFGYVPCDII